MGKDEKEARFLYGGEQYIIADEDIERLKNGEILNFFVNMEYGCTLRYEKENKSYIEKYRSESER